MPDPVTPVQQGYYDAKNPPPGLAGTDLEAWLRRQNLYGLDNPEMAFNNTLRDAGLGLDNPLVQRTLVPAARGLANAFRIQQAGNPANNTGQPITDLGEMFRQFLGGAIQSGQSFGDTLGHAAQQMRDPGFINGLVNVSNLKSSGTQALNPFANQLIDAGVLSDPSAVGNLMSSFAQPFMGQGLAQALQQGFLRQGNIGYREAGLKPGDFIRFLMGI
jgi:hypothetical protein